MLVIFGIIILKNLSKFKFGKDPDEQRPRQQPPSEPPKRRYAPLDEEGRVIKRAQPQSQRQSPVAQPIRHPEAAPAAPIAPAQAKIMPEHDHTREFAARKKYQQEQLARKEKLAAANAKRRIAQQVRQKAAARPKPTPKPEPEVIEAVAAISLDNFTSQPENLRTAFVLSEILGKPIALRQHSSMRIY